MSRGDQERGPGAGARRKGAGSGGVIVNLVACCVTAEEEGSAKKKCCNFQALNIYFLHFSLFLLLGRLWNKIRHERGKTKNSLIEIR